MRWFSFAMLVALLLVLQSTLAPRFELFGARPDWLLVAVVFFAMHVAPREAIIGSWILGLSADLMTIERLGLMAVTYALIAMAVVSVRDYLFRRQALTQFIVTVAACVAVRLAWTVYVRLLYDPAQSVLVSLIQNVVWGSIYTAAWAPIVHQSLLRISRTLGVPRPRYTFAR